jgi:glyoxylase-like metal-dependent hydrolase (beta-lactamase superfamily II)
MDGRHESMFERAHLANHNLLIETNNELILVDTGYGLEEVRNPQARLSKFFLNLLQPEFREELTAIRQIEKLGYNPKDVRHIVLTHLDFDHAGGLDDFPWATVHMMRSERDSAFKRKTWLDKQRYRPQQWATRKNWRVYDLAGGTSWFGFDKAQELQGLPPEISLIPLIGHTFGHAGVAIKGDKWLFNTGDAYFFHEEMNLEKPHCTPGLEFYQTMMEKDRKSRLWNQERLRHLKRDHENEVEIFCSHDPVEFEKLSGRSLEVPPQMYIQSEITL